LHQHDDGKPSKCGFDHWDTLQFGGMKTSPRRRRRSGSRSSLFRSCGIGYAPACLIGRMFWSANRARIPRPQPKWISWCALDPRRAATRVRQALP